MGEISEMMIDGILCEGCGEFMGGGAPGYPRRCRSCGPIPKAPRPASRMPKPHIRAEIARNVAKKHVCHCGKRFEYATALVQHEKAKHGGQK